MYLCIHLLWIIKKNILFNNLEFILEIFKNKVEVALYLFT
jgi:hypothetical protein